MIANAEGDASRFSADHWLEYQKAPAVTRERMYLDTMQQVMSNTSKVMVDQKGGNSLLYLPLDKLQQMAAQPRSAARRTCWRSPRRCSAAATRPDAPSYALARCISQP